MSWELLCGMLYVPSPSLVSRNGVWRYGIAAIACGAVAEFVLHVLEPNLTLSHRQ